MSMPSSLHALTEWIAQTALSIAIQNILWIVPLVQTVHLVAVAAVLSSMLMIGLRVLDLAGRFQTLPETVDRFLPWVWGGLAVLATTGAVLIIGEPARTLQNPSFWVKMTLLAIVVVAALALERGVRRRPGLTEAGWRRSGTARLAVAFNFALWCAVAVAGRWIAYTKT